MLCNEHFHTFILLTQLMIFSCYILMCIVFVCCCVYLCSSGCIGVFFGPPHLLAGEPRRPGVLASVSVLLIVLVHAGSIWPGLHGLGWVRDLCIRRPVL